MPRAQDLGASAAAAAATDDELESCRLMRSGMKDDNKKQVVCGKQQCEQQRAHERQLMMTSEIESES